MPSIDAAPWSLGDSEMAGRVRARDWADIPLGPQATWPERLRLAVELVLARTPFYARAGGQTGDAGTVRTASGALVEITDTRYALDELRVHSGRVAEGEVLAGEPALAAVDAPRRHALMRAHSATHILHAVVRDAGHFLQEDAGAELGALAVRLVREVTH